MTLNTPPLTARELAEVEEANGSDRRPVVFVHGLWLLASSWDPWRALFEERGYATLAPDWPDDPSTVEEGRAHPEIFAGKSIGVITDHFAAVIRQLKAKPAVVGHSFGGLIAQKLAGQSLASVSVAIDPAP
ncbi:MAG TPA: alpha/beta fold hydrolase, partial [Acidimicrobiales bacterium]|nr:alpha/beta fold hydrolase [Acidimicrobiales bacterium]